MEYLVLLGIAVVIVGFALRLDAILIVFLAAIPRCWAISASTVS